jgi:hypothetical protein
MKPELPKLPAFYACAQARQLKSGLGKRIGPTIAQQWLNAIEGEIQRRTVSARQIAP